MKDVCPHCGVTLPEVGDSFCPECRRPITEAPDPIPAPPPTPAGAVRRVRPTSPQAQTPSPARRPVVLFAILFAIALLLILTVLWLNPLGEGDAAGSGEPQVVSAEQLRNEFRNSPKEAARRYAGARLVLTGRVVSVDSTSLYQKGNWSVTVTGEEADTNDFPWIGCRVSDARVPSFAAVWIDDVVTIEGVFSRGESQAIFLKDCKLLKHRPKPKK
jgi:tRNA_anti-like